MMFDKELKVAQELILQAGRIVMKHYATEIEVDLKKEREPVTQADRESNEFITTEISKLFPHDGILAEESKDNRERLQKERVWLIDPMDGTREFVDKVGQFAVMIGLAVGGHPVLGVVYQPTTDTMFYAIKEQGAFVRRNGETRKLSVSNISDTRQMRMVVSRSHRSPLVTSIKETLGIAKEVASGSVGLKVGLLAEQKSDLYPHPNSKTKEWDTCAPEIILTEAGGRITDCWGAPLIYNKENVFNAKGFVASNAYCHDEIIERIQPFLASMD